MTSLLFPFIAALVIALASCVGVVLAPTQARTWMSRHMTILMSFVSGVFLITAFFLIRETFEFLTTPVALLVIVGGFIGFWLLQHLIPEFHHHHACDTCDDHTHDQRSAIKMLASDAFHNIADGIILVPAFAVDVRLGIITTLGILAHELVQEFSEYIVLRHAGYSHRKALGRNFIVACSIFIGVGISLIFKENLIAQAILLGISAGAFLNIVFTDLIPYRSVRKENIFSSILWFIVGALAVFMIQSIVPHAHDHSEHDHDEHEHELVDRYEHDNDHEELEHEEEHGHSHKN